MTIMKTTYFSKLSFAFLVGLGAATALTSCSFEDEDYFDQPAALRIEQATTDIQKILVDAPNGWVMQYFTGMNEVEGFNLLARFDQNGKVTLGGNHRYLRDGNANKYTEATSLYQMLREDGPVLAFNTWNEILTPFIDPVDYKQAPRVLVKDGEGMHGDHNLVVTSYSKDEILLRGERYGAIVRMVPCPAESWQEYIDSVAATKNRFATSAISNYYVINGTDTLYFKNLRSGVITYCERIDDPLFPTTINCVFTPVGFRLHHQNNINGTTFQEFHISPDSTCLLSENDSVRVVACWNDYIINSFKSGSHVWYFDAADFKGQQATVYSQLVAEVAKSFNGGGKLEGIGLGTTDNKASYFVLRFSFVNRGQTVYRTASMPVSIVKTDFNKFEIIFNSSSKGDANMNTLVAQGAKEAESLLRSLAATLVGTYTFIPNNYFLPSSFTMTDESNNTYTLSHQ